MVSAPSETARPTGIESTRPPSKKCSPLTATGGSSPGTAQEASTAGTTGPLENQCALARSMLAATQWNGSCRSAKSPPGSDSSSIRRSGSIECRCVPDLASRATCPKKVSLNACSSASPCQAPASHAAAPAGSAATNAPLIAPTEVPTTTSGTMPASDRARSMPTSWAPSTPPPPSTNAFSTPCLLASSKAGSAVAGGDGPGSGQRAQQVGAGWAGHLEGLTASRGLGEVLAEPGPGHDVPRQRQHRDDLYERTEGVGVEQHGRQFGRTAGRDGAGETERAR